LKSQRVQQVPEAVQELLEWLLTKVTTRRTTVATAPKC